MSRAGAQVPEARKVKHADRFHVHDGLRCSRRAPPMVADGTLSRRTNLSAHRTPAARASGDPETMLAD